MRNRVVPSQKNLPPSFISDDMNSSGSCKDGHNSLDHQEVLVIFELVRFPQGEVQ